MAYIQSNSPIKKVRKTTKGKGRNFRSTEEGAGMTSKGVKEYKKPGKSVPTTKTWAILLNLEFQKMRLSSSELAVPR